MTSSSRATLRRAGLPLRERQVTDNYQTVSDSVHEIEMARRMASRARRQARMQVRRDRLSNRATIVELDETDMEMIDAAANFNFEGLHDEL